MNRRLWVSWSLLFAACGFAPDAPPADPFSAGAVTAPAARVAAEAPRPPFVLRVDPVAAVPAGGEAELAVTVERSSPSRIPVQLRVEPGAGLRLLEGAAAETLDEEGPAIARRFRVAVENPAATLTVTASLAVEGMGAHAVRQVRFDGKADEPPPLPRPGGTVVPDRR